MLLFHSPDTNIDELAHVIDNWAFASFESDYVLLYVRVCKFVPNTVDMLVI